MTLRGAPRKNPEIVFNRFGDGRVIYCSSLVETLEGLRETFLRMVRQLCESYRVEVTAPACVEVTTFHQVDRRRYVLSDKRTESSRFARRDWKR